MSEDATIRTTTGRGEFFAVDRRAWAVACRQGLNPAVAYLVLACFTGRDQRTTKAGVHAIERHAGIARSRARAAVEALERAGLVTKPEGKGITRRIMPAHEVSGCQGYPPPEVDQREQTLLDELTGHGSTWVTDKGGRRTTAHGLVAKGRARHLGNNYYQAVPYDAEAAARPDWIWLPNALVTGVADEVPPVELVRQSGDPRALRVLVDLYHAQNLVSDGGVHWRRIRRDFKRVKVGERGPFVVWGFQDDTDRAWKNAPFVAPHLTGQVDENGPDEGWNPFWAAWGALKTLGLVELVGHLIEADADEAEVIHPFAVDNGEPVERELAEAAHRAGLAMVTRGQYEWACGELGGSPRLVPVRRHITGATVVGIARLRYRPRTAATAAWFARTEDWRRMIDRYRVMEAEAADQRAVGAA